MFLAVSARLMGMDEMTDAERVRLGIAVRDARMEHYPTKLAAYQDAGVNSATWDRIEKGESVKAHTLRQVIKTLWPPAGGDWRRVPGVKYADLDYSMVGDPESNDYYLRLERWVFELQTRVDLLERHVYHDTKETEDEPRDPAPSTRAEVSSAPDEEDVSDDGYMLAALDRNDDDEVEAQQVDP